MPKSNARTPEVAEARGRLGAIYRWRPGNQAELHAAQSRLNAAVAAAELVTYVDKVIAAWPALPDDQRARIAELLGSRCDQEGDSRMGPPEN